MQVSSTSYPTNGAVLSCVVPLPGEFDQMYLLNNRITVVIRSAYIRNILKFIMYLASKVRSFTLATRLVVAAWCLAGIVFVNTYTSSLVSHLMAPRFLPLINTVQDLSDSYKLNIAVRKFTVEYATLMVSNMWNMKLETIFKNRLRLLCTIQAYNTFRFYTSGHGLKAIILGLKCNLDLKCIITVKWGNFRHAG